MSKPSSASEGPVSALAQVTGSECLDFGTPACVEETYRLLGRELDRKQGMIEDLHQLAHDNYGMTPEDCDLLVVTCTDRDNLGLARKALFALFGPQNDNASRGSSANT